MAIGQTRFFQIFLCKQQFVKNMLHNYSDLGWNPKNILGQTYNCYFGSGVLTQKQSEAVFLVMCDPL
jgi:hypothetical protein